jgi:F0F1-type ATP synthase epsilon subunit
MIEETTASAQAVEVAKQQKTGGKPTMHVKVYSPFKVYFEDDAYSISGVNATGPFDILPHHHHFMTLLSPCELVVKTAGGPLPEQKIRISGGLMHVKADQVTVFLDV